MHASVSRLQPDARAGRRSARRDPGRPGLRQALHRPHGHRRPGPPDAGWHDGRARRRTARSPLDPAAAVLHYAQEIFEGLKAYRHADGSIWTFRPEANAARFARSARRLALPELPRRGLPRRRSTRWSRTDQRVGARPAAEKSLYLRPFMFATEAFLGVRPASEVTLLRDRLARPAPTSPAASSRSSIWLSERLHPRRARRHRRGQVRRQLRREPGRPAARPPSTAATRSSSSTPSSARWVEELGGMNLFFVHARRHASSPPS